MIELTDRNLKNFWAKIDKRGPDDCWEWQAGKVRGYGSIRIAGRARYAHRIAYMIAYDDLPDDQLVCHDCDNPACCNPAHLFIGTHLDNARDCWAKGRGVINLPKDQAGEKAPGAKLTENQVREIKCRLRNGESRRVIALAYGVTRSNIDAIAWGRSWAFVP